MPALKKVAPVKKPAAKTISAPAKKAPAKKVAPGKAFDIAIRGLLKDAVAALDMHASGKSKLPEDMQLEPVYALGAFAKRHAELIQLQTRQSLKPTTTRERKLRELRRFQNYTWDAHLVLPEYLAKQTAMVEGDAAMPKLVEQHRKAQHAVLLARLGLTAAQHRRLTQQFETRNAAYRVAQDANDEVTMAVLRPALEKLHRKMWPEAM